MERLVVVNRSDVLPVGSHVAFPQRFPISSSGWVKQVRGTPNPQPGCSVRLDDRVVSQVGFDGAGGVRRTEKDRLDDSTGSNARANFSVGRVATVSRRWQVATPTRLVAVRRWGRGFRWELGCQHKYFS